MTDPSMKEEEYFPISRLPDRTVLHIFSFLDGQSRLRSECVCKKWWELITFSQFERMPRFVLDSFLVSLSSNQWSSFPPGYYNSMKLLHMSLKLDETEERKELYMNILEKLAVKQTAEVQGNCSFD